MKQSDINSESISIKIPSKPWTENHPPSRVLAIRLHAIGDVVITLPYLQQLKNNLPQGSRLDLLIRKETDDIPRNILLFDKVYSIGGGRNYKKQLVHSAFVLPLLLLNRYDVVIDLQNNIVSKFFRKALMPKAWSEFDRFSPIPAGERTRLTIEAAGFQRCEPYTKLTLKEMNVAKQLLQENGWNENNNLVILNPAGAFETRNWPINNYIAFAKLWLQQFPKTQFVVTGVGSISSKADFLKSQLGDHLINLINQTSASQAFAAVNFSKFVLSEDSGLMHMAWVCGIPTLAIFGSTRSDWARPLGEHSSFLDSSDIPCGNCMKEICIYGDNRCMTRYTPEEVFEKATGLLNKIKKSQTNNFASAK